LANTCSFFFAQKEGFLLESQNNSSCTASYTFGGVKPSLILRGFLNRTEIIKGNKKIIEKGNPLVILAKYLEKYSVNDINSSIPFTCGAVGYFAYELVQLFEQICPAKINNFDIPLSYWMFFDTILCYEHSTQKSYILTRKKDKIEIKEIFVPFLSLYSPLDTPSVSSPLDKGGHRGVTSYKIGKIKTNLSQEEYENIVKRTKNYITAGDIFQANLSVRLEMDFEGSEFKLYQNLKKINPSPFAGYINFGDIKIVSSSPERLIVKRGDKLQTRPIAGTRRRGKTKEEDNFFKEELLLSEKERAEHIMLVDLERNDLGRICKFGSVKVDELMVLEQYSHVTHIVSNVAGVLNDNITLPQIIRAVFPGGTITGTPKVRSMEVIAELEPTTRGIYTGSMGYLSYNGNLDLNIIIRTVFIFNGKAYVQAGAGIVADSIPHREYKESLYKAEALIEALKEKKIQG